MNVQKTQAHLEAVFIRIYLRFEHLRREICSCGVYRDKSVDSANFFKAFRTPKASCAFKGQSQFLLRRIVKLSIRRLVMGAGMLPCCKDCRVVQRTARMVTKMTVEGILFPSPM